MSTILAADLCSFDRVDYLHFRNVQLGDVQHVDSYMHTCHEPNEVAGVEVCIASVICLAPGEVLRRTWFTPTTPLDVYEGPELPIPIRMPAKLAPRRAADVAAMVNRAKASARAFLAYNPSCRPVTAIRVERSGRGYKARVVYGSNQGSTTHSVHYA